MKSLKPILLSASLAAASFLAPAANGQTVKIAAAGSSAVFLSIGDAAVQDAPAICGANHWSKKSHGFMHDNRTGLKGITIPDEKADIWITWDGLADGSTATVVCAYVAVDSGIGVRGYMAVPRAGIYTDSAALTAGDNLITALPTNDSPLPDKVRTALNGPNNPVTGTTINIAFTDVRPEDVQYATARMLSKITPNRSGLGYGNWPNVYSTPANGYVADVLQGSSLGSSYSTKLTIPDWFEISPLGQDPFSGSNVVRWQTYPVGAVPIMIIVSNEDNSVTGFGSGLTPAETAAGPWTAGPYVASNINTPTAGYVFDGSLSRTVDILTGGQTLAANCKPEGQVGGAAGGAGSNNCALTTLIREPLSGTYNTFEFTVPRTHFLQLSVEDGIDPSVANNNPLAITQADGATRLRGIGTGEIVNGVCGVHIPAYSPNLCTSGPTSGTALSNRIGYTFWSYNNLAPIAGNHGVGTGTTYNTNPPLGHYLTLNGIDPLFSTPSANPEGALNPPICTTAPCNVIPFTHLIDGTYAAWTVVQAVVDTTISKGDGSPQDTLLSKLPLTASNFSDFLPETSMQFFRAHRDANVVGIGARNGNGGGCNVLDYGNDYGQSAGGMIFSRENDLDYAYDNGGNTSTCANAGAPADAGLTNLTQ